MFDSEGCLADTDQPAVSEDASSSTNQGLLVKFNRYQATRWDSLSALKITRNLVEQIFFTWLVEIDLTEVLNIDAHRLFFDIDSRCDFVKQFTSA